MRKLYWVVGVISTAITAASFIGLVLSVCTWDVESTILCGMGFAWFAFTASVAGKLLEE